MLTGFLGAGKTTLLRNFLATPEGRGTAVIVNEYGAVGIDDALIRDSTDQTTLLGNGCVCCVTRTDLQNALRNLVIDRERGKIPPFVRIVIETSGMADPAPILQTFATDRALGGEFFVEVVVTVVDAATGLETIGWSSESRKQVILADRLILSKTDLAHPDADDGLRVRLRELNSHAEIIVANEGHVDPACLIEGIETGERSAFVAEAEHSDGIASFVVTDNLPLKWASFARTMETLVALARLGPAAGQRLPRRPGLPRAGAGAVRAAPRASAGGTRCLAGRRAWQPHRLHHPEHFRSAGARAACCRERDRKQQPDSDFFTSAGLVFPIPAPWTTLDLEQS